MTLKSHAELEQYHYTTLKNYNYQTEGMVDCRMEELSNQMPYYIPKPVQEIKPMFRPRPIHHEIDELKAQLRHLHLEIDRLKVVKREGDLT